ncbi:MAG: hypothetical protein E7582_01935 [Ruminococcaceae bacterium]|nr:hypothetical protein [Oscillospiraceae bacterium]
MENLFHGKYRKITLALYIIFVILWLTFIFSNSLANGYESTIQSDRIVELVRKITQFFDSEVMVETDLIRTGAHFFEFFVLGLLYSLGTLFFKGVKPSRLFYTLSLSLFTAFIDETLQLFSQGRGAEITDVWVDLSGAFIAHMIFVIITYSYKFFKKKA